MGAPGVFTNNFGTHNSGYAPAMIERTAVGNVYAAAAVFVGNLIAAD